MVKLVIWDLDETLWRGTLADGDAVALFEHRANLVRRLNQHGVVSSICSKNDYNAARAKLEEFGLWDEFVFPRIAFAPKGDAVAGIIADMQLRAADVLFVDDNPVNLEEAQHRQPGLRTLDIREPTADAALEAIFSSQPPSRNRLAEYRSLERKKQDRQSAPAASDEDFLRSCEIRACAPAMMANLDFIDRIIELINRSNQLNYTNSRVDHDGLRHDMIDRYLDYYCWSIFAWDKYGDHGLIGFAMVHRHDRYLKHFVFSCRIMHMGLERYALRKVEEICPDVIVPDHWRGRLGEGPADWIEDLCYEDPETRQALFASQGRAVDQAPQLRIMHACQSGGLAHYSAHRGVIDFDIHPRIFGLADYHSGRAQDAALPPFVVYGAGIDYKDESWDDELAEMLDGGLFMQCVHNMGQHLMQKGVQALIFLPPENLPEKLYGPKGLTLIRTIIYNGIWREAAELFPCFSIVDVDRVCLPDEMVDVNHARPEALQTLSSLIDVWYEHASAASGGALTDAA